MDWLSSTLAQIAAQPVVGYAPGQAPAAEPTAVAALALLAADRARGASAALKFLVASQRPEGFVGIRQGGESPGWPTSLAILAWRAADEAAGAETYKSCIRRGVEWTLEARGTAMPPTPEMGHNTQLVAWSWAENTHSWIEPTALHVLALQRAGFGEHARVHEAIRLLIDRLLPSGGCNYGNTVVLGQTLRPHVQPTGLAMLALAGATLHKPEAPARETVDGRDGANPRLRVGLVSRSLGYLQRSLVPPITAASLAWGLLGLEAHGVELPQRDELLAAAHARVMSHDRSPHKLALLALAAQESSLSLLVTSRGQPG